MPPNPIDRAQRLMAQLGWCFGDYCYSRNQEPTWQVCCYRGEERIIVRAFMQLEAWDEALWQAGSYREARMVP